MMSSFGEVIEHLIEYLCSSQRKNYRSGKEFSHGERCMVARSAMPPLNRFEGARALALEAERGLSLKAGEYELIPTDAMPSDLDGPLNCCLLTSGDSEDLSVMFQLTRFREVKLSLVRGKIKQVMPVVYEFSVAFLHYGGGYSGDTLLYGAGSRSSDRLFKIGPMQLYSPMEDEEGAMAERLHWASGLQFSQHFEWLVTLGLEGYPSLSFVTDPVGAAAVFRLRDIEPGLSRRAALLHWVQQHWRRKKRIDAEAEIFVRKHLRGREVFHWNGLRCVIAPSKHDLIQLGYVQKAS